MMTELVRVNLRKQVAEIDTKMERLLHRKMEILQRLGESKEEKPSSSTGREVNDVQRKDSACGSTHDEIRKFDGSCGKTTLFQDPVCDKDTTDKGDDKAAMLAYCVDHAHQVGCLDVVTLAHYVAENELPANFFEDVFLKADPSLPVKQIEKLTKEWQDYVRRLMKRRI